MSSESTSHGDTPPDPREVALDPAAFKKAHEKYGGYLQEGGLPFEPEELDELDADASDTSEGSDSSGS